MNLSELPRGKTAAIIKEARPENIEIEIFIMIVVVVVVVVVMVISSGSIIFIVTLPLQTEGGAPELPCGKNHQMGSIRQQLSNHRHHEKQDKK